MALIPACREIIFSMLQRQPESRPSILEILGDDWLKNTLRHQDIENEFVQRRAYIQKIEAEAMRLD